MPTWIAYIIGAAAVVTALGVLWKKAIRPAANFIAEFVIAEREMLPLVKELTAVFRDSPDAFKVLKAIAGQFKADSGSSLKDQINRLESAAGRQELAAQKAEANAEHLKVGVASQKELAEDDRQQLRKLLIELGINAQAMTSLSAAVENIKKDARSVADDLAAAHKRADDVSDQPHGAAADAAAQQTAKEKAKDL